MSNATFKIPLECGHAQGYKPPYPTAKQAAYCRRCGDWSLVLESVEELYHLTCEKCSYSRQFPATVSFLEAKAHLIRHPDHITLLHDSQGELVEKYEGMQPLEIEGMSLREIQRRASELIRKSQS